MKIQLGKLLPRLLVLPLLGWLPARAQTFTLDQPLQTARWSHLAAWLTNGQVLIAGGRIANDYATSQWANTNSCELYDPTTASATPTDSMADAHASGAAVVLTNGLVLVVAGENNGQYPITGAELYDASLGAWRATGSLQQERAAFAAERLLDGRVLVTGGWDGGSVGEVSSAELYNPSTGTWSNAAPMSFAADSQTATRLPDGTVLVAGGSDNGNPLTNAILYYPANNTWTNTGPLNLARSGHAATLLPNGKVLVVGNAGASAEVYDPATRAWRVVASMHDGRDHPSATLLPSGQVLVLGGDPDTTSAELYDSTNDVWTYTGPLNVGRVFHTATLAAYGQVVVAGGDAGTIGYYNGPGLAAIETYDQLPQYSPLALALNATNLAWSTSGDANWFSETTNTYDGVSAAQSGSVTNAQTSTLTTTVTGPGILTFLWSTIANDTNAGFNCEFDLDGGAVDSIFGDTAWQAEPPFAVAAGEHALSWTASANGDADPTQAAFVDQICFVPTTPADQPVGWWKADGNARDSVASHDGIPHGGVTFSTGVLGQAFDLDGSGDYVELPPVSADLAQGTIALWTYLRAWNWQSAGSGTFLWSGTAYLPDSGQSWDGINLGNHPGYTSTGELLFGLYTYDWQWAHSGVVPDLNRWYHVAGTWGPGGVRIYVNGQLLGTNAYAGPAPNSSFNLIGRSSWDNSGISGLVDDVRLYNRALSGAEIQALLPAAGIPQLTVRAAGANVVISWPIAAGGFGLESTPSLSRPAWTPVTDLVSWSGTNFVFTPAATGPARFFRLKR